MRKMVDNYGKLSDKQKSIVPNDIFTLLRQYLSLKLRLASAALERDIIPRPELEYW